MRWVITVLLVSGSYSPASFAADLEDLLGVWTPIDSSAGIVKVEVSVVEDSVGVQVWGECTPEPCDWSRVEGFAYAPSVSVHPFERTMAISAEFEFPIKTSVVVLRPEGDGRVRMDVLARFPLGNKHAYLQTLSLEPETRVAVNGCGSWPEARVETGAVCNCSRDEDCAEGYHCSFANCSHDGTSYWGMCKVNR